MYCKYFSSYHNHMEIYTIQFVFFINIMFSCRQTSIYLPLREIMCSWNGLRHSIYCDTLLGNHHVTFISMTACYFIHFVLVLTCWLVSVYFFLPWNSYLFWWMGVPIRDLQGYIVKFSIFCLCIVRTLIVHLWPNTSWSAIALLLIILWSLQ